MQSSLHTGSTLILKVKYDASDSTEKQIGICTSISFNVTQGQKAIYVVDSPFPAEIAQAAAPSAVAGNAVFLLPKFMNLETLGLVPYRTDSAGTTAYAAQSRYLHFKLYDRRDKTLVYSMDYVKVGSFSMSVVSRRIVQVSLNFEGFMLTPGVSQ